MGHADAIQIPVIDVWNLPVMKKSIWMSRGVAYYSTTHVIVGHPSYCKGESKTFIADLRSIARSGGSGDLLPRRGALLGWVTKVEEDRSCPTKSTTGRTWERRSCRRKSWSSGRESWGGRRKSGGGRREG